MDRRSFSRATLAAAVAAIAGAGHAQTAPYPSRTVKIIAPVAPGGGVDLVARTVAERLQKALGQPFIVDNMSGGGGVIAAQATMRAPADGYTLMLGYVATHGTNPAMRNIPYDAVKDFTAIAMVAGTPNVLVVGSGVPAASVKELVALAKRSPLSFGSAGQGSLTHLLVEQFKLAVDIQATHAPYRGIAPAITDVLGGQTQFMMPGLAAALQHIKSGKLRPLAVTGNKRHAVLPEVPTFEELGFSGFTAVQWYGIVGPAKMPLAVVSRLNEEINRAIALPELRERLSGEALEPMPMSSAEFSAFIAAEVARWTKLVRERNIEIGT
ncbi:Bug family tripartite tricarboxylate transporter substrate binding protein [Casimicrobium huifangae]|uniref:Bug family tripartite tricarboxylate transporter substrate binding protein n=1 Tax=Casimicrobium huifangae TaxID=2591109 RepID=UPI0012ECBA1B|nr:tripartite tricarboxylate transporter substrate binding protein [Casimicrobium huifangae]